MSRLIPYKKLMPADRQSTGNETAIDLIYNFLNEPALRKLSSLAIGGTFPLSYFQLGDGACAKQFWYCYDKRHAQPQVYLAMEDSAHPWPRNRKASEIPTMPESDILHRPEVTFTFDDNTFDRTDISQVDQFILTHKDCNRHVCTISSGDVRNFSHAFIERFGGRAENREFCYYPLAHFENFTPEIARRVIDEFLQIRNIHYVRYYFGLETSKDHGANRIRVVLVPVSKEHTRLRADGGINDVLQWSWPPEDKELLTKETFKVGHDYLSVSTFESAVII